MKTLRQRGEGAQHHQLVSGGPGILAQPARLMSGTFTHICMLPALAADGWVLGPRLSMDRPVWKTKASPTDFRGPPCTPSPISLLNAAEDLATSSLLFNLPAGKIFNRVGGCGGCTQKGEF